MLPPWSRSPRPRRLVRGELGASPLLRSTVLHAYGDALVAVRDPHAVDILEEVRALVEAQYGPDHEGVAQTLNSLGLAQSKLLGDRELGAQTIGRAIAIADRTGGWESAPTLAVGLHINLGVVLLGLDPERARAELERTVEQMPDDAAFDDMRIHALWYLADAHDRLDQREAADARSGQALARARELRQPQRPRDRELAQRTRPVTLQPRRCAPVSSRAWTPARPAR